ncbi:MAG: T9SS type A sorting domain-containing protein [Flavobacteriales bacterium]|nr:T9SS type A sorting domain-containing protein [Flavobacteriales bacterium]
MRTTLRIVSTTFSLWVVQCACALTLNITGTRANCPDYLDGTATANATGGTEPYTYLWNTGATTQQITDLVPGSYTCTVTDAMGTTAFDTYVVQEEDLYFNYGVLGVQASCDGPCTGQMRFDTTQVPGGVAPFTFDPPPSYWLGDVAYFENLCAFQFDYSITDATGCTQQTGVPIALPAYLLGDVTDVDAGCNGAANGSISYTLSLFDVPPGMEWPVTFIADDGSGNTYPTTGYTFAQNTVDGTITEIPPGSYTLYAEFPTPCGLSTYTLPVTVPDLGPDCGSVQGTVWYDFDQDCMIDVDEPRVVHRVSTILPGPRYVITNSAGFYSAGLDYGSYTLSQNSSDLEQICPAATPVPFTLDGGNQLAVVDLADTSNIAFDLETDCFLNIVRPGFEVNGWLRVRNGSVYPSDVVTLTYTYEAPLVLVSASVPPTVNTPGYLEWQIPVIAGSSAQTIHMVFTTPPDPDLLGTVVNTAASATNAGAETLTSNNTCTQASTITGAYDPNDKTARTSSGSSEVSYFLTEDNSITYTIRFQNTGTDTAFTVVIRDELEADLDPGSVDILGASHPFEPAFENGRTLVFTFNDILLPDSGTNEAASHGFIRFRIRPRTDLLLGDVIENSAAIYFDFNPPVITAPSQLLVESSTSVQELDTPILSLWPVPADDVLYVGSSEAVRSVRILSVDGRTAIHQRSRATTPTINVSSLRPGAYLVIAILTNGTEAREHFIKQ